MKARSPEQELEQPHVKQTQRDNFGCCCHKAEHSLHLGDKEALQKKDLDLQIPPAEVTEGQSAVLTCKTTCSLTDPTFIWYKNSHHLTTKTSESNEVHLQSVSSEDAGSYSCAVRGYEHLRSPAQTLSVRYPPKNVLVSISPSGDTVEGSSVTLTCSSDANPPVQNYTWFKVNESSPVGSGQSYRAVQSGQYYCEAQNKHGSERSAAVSVTVNDGFVIVYVAVGLGLFGLAAVLSALFWLRSKRQKKKADEGDRQNTGPSAKDDTYANVELSQISLPSPPADTPTTSDYENIAIRAKNWFVMIDFKDAYFHIGILPKHRNFLRLSDVKKTDEHMYYFRITTNTEKERFMGYPGVTLTVTDLDLQIAPAEVTEGQSAVLTCKTTCSLTDPTFIWYKNSHHLTTKTSESNEVHLQSVSSEDAGSYSCAVRGYEHLRSPAQTLSVRYPPKNVTVSISPSAEIVEGNSLTLTCSSDANPPVKTYTWYKGVTSVGNEKTYNISKIRSEDSGKYKCKCSNEVGHQDSNSVTLNVLYPPKNISVSISASGEIAENSSVTLTCSSDANPLVQNYTWFKEKESSPVGPGRSYRAVQSGQYYCKAHERSNLNTALRDQLQCPPLLMVRVMIFQSLSDGSLIVYVAVGLGLFGLAAVLSAVFWLRL
ncbi:hypothetical protein QTP70_013513 [Hemibagrus guttatus]|uniref:Ig-like domain-containing protein n=1 Tax=Hemibagrus guttatus TaxID=175788 RepID=A0AAE0PYR6_9TELE|nr:hypothetical protein QTP70_013513 [Hemibagrus guttatus]